MGVFGDLSRVSTNLQALNSLRVFNKTNIDLGVRQLRLATGERINRAEDDAAGFSIANKLEARVRGQAQALSNVGDAKSLLTVAEGTFGTLMDILQTMKEKAVQAANDTLGVEERSSIEHELKALSDEITEIIEDTKFNSAALFTTSVLSFQVNADAGDTFKVSLGTLSVTQFGLATASIDVSSASSASTMISVLNDAIIDMANQLGNIGDSQKRLSFKQDMLAISMNNNEAARSRVADADFAKEQMELVKLQILQQTGINAIAQANAAPQAVLALLQ